MEGADDHKAWFVDNELHRTDGPAIEWADGTKKWYVDGEPHRIDGPAIEWADGDKAWFVGGNLQGIEQSGKRCNRLQTAMEMVSDTDQD